jgi:1-acylglycerone phosphate reductase
VDGYIVSSVVRTSARLTLIKGIYASSKRAIEVVTDTLRLELAPFGVSMLTVVTGAVKASGQTYFDDLELPKGSLYKTIRETIISRAQGNDGVPRMDTMKYAKAVVDDMEKGRSGKIWHGEYVEMVKASATNVVVFVEAMVSCRTECSSSWTMG